MNATLNSLIIKKNRDVILNRAKDYYEIYKERLRGQARDKYRNYLKKKKIKKREYEKTDTTIIVSSRRIYFILLLFCFCKIYF